MTELDGMQMTQQEAMNQVAEMITRNWSSVYVKMQTGKAHHTGPGKYSYGVGINIKLEPIGNSVIVTSKISWSEKMSDEISGQVMLEPDMFTEEKS